jgi:hypothetical protein
MQAGRGGGTETKITLKLKVEGEKLTGTVTQPGRGGGAATDIAISEGKVKGEEISFSVVRDMGGTPMTKLWQAPAHQGQIDVKAWRWRPGHD